MQESFVAVVKFEAGDDWTNNQSRGHTQGEALHLACTQVDRQTKGTDGGTTKNVKS